MSFVHVLARYLCTCQVLRSQNHDHCAVIVSVHLLVGYQQDSYS